LTFWAVVIGLLITALVARHLGSPSWLPDVAVAVAFVLLLPVMVDTLTCGLVGRRFVTVRHRRWAIAAYVFALSALCAPRLHWPLFVSWLSGSFALVITALLLLAEHVGRLGRREVS